MVGLKGTDIGRQAGPGDIALLGRCRSAFDWWERFSRSRQGLGVMFAWALAEATVWPIIPDALLAPMAAGARRTFPRLWLAAVVGSFLGGIALYLFSLAAPQAALDLIASLPVVKTAMLWRAAGLLAEQGVHAFWVQPWTGVSFKIFAVLGAGQQMDPWQVMPVSIAARALRMGVNGAAIALIAWPLRNFLRDFSLFLLVAYLAIFGYGWWLTQM